MCKGETLEIDGEEIAVPQEELPKVGRIFLLSLLCCPFTVGLSLVWLHFYTDGLKEKYGTTTNPVPQPETASAQLLRREERERSDALARQFQRDREEALAVIKQRSPANPPEARQPPRLRRVADLPQQHYNLDRPVAPQAMGSPPTSNLGNIG